MHKEEPVWVWEYANGWKEYVNICDVAVQSTQCADKSEAVIQAEQKVQDVYKHLGLPAMDSFKLRSKIMSWRSLSGSWVAQQVHQTASTNSATTFVCCCEVCV